MDEFVEGSTPFAVQNTYTFLMDTIDDAISLNNYLQGVSEAALVYKWLLATEYPGGFQTIDDQIDYCNTVEETLKGQNLPADTLDFALTFMDGLRGILNSYESRQRPLRWLDMDRFEGVLGEINTTLIAGLLYGNSGEWGDAGLVQAEDAQPGNTAAEYLADLAHRFETRATNGELGAAAVIPSPKPLLYQLIEMTLPLVPNLSLAKDNVLAALNGLGRA